MLTVSALDSPYRSWRALVHFCHCADRSTTWMSTKPAFSKSSTYCSGVVTVGAKTTSSKLDRSCSVKDFPGFAAKSSITKVPPSRVAAKQASSSAARSGMCKKTSSDRKWSKLSSGMALLLESWMMSPTWKSTFPLSSVTRFVSCSPASQMSAWSSTPVTLHPVLLAMYRAGPPIPEPMSKQWTVSSMPSSSMTWSLASTPP
mmetsp:Transcript_11902/g.28188  ORF Transcript_11902/g.28188 Transcript_11902/m.28188 type:complete len:202 (+) Transcript_11902:425-1030(+)